MLERKPRAQELLRKGGCAEKERLEREFLETVRELIALHSQQTKAVIEGDAEFSRFDLLIHVANDRKEWAKYSLIAHIESHGCAGE
ncbi:MAG TPA: hypothetical protein VMU80_07995 [Bryobacteraceae bacterium]|nr:hypothetical protein [Bryobacteraceae bacterium]